MLYILQCQCKSTHHKLPECLHCYYYHILTLLKYPTLFNKEILVRSDMIQCLWVKDLFYTWICNTVQFFSAKESSTTFHLSQWLWYFHYQLYFDSFNFSYLCSSKLYSSFWCILLHHMAKFELKVFVGWIEWIWSALLTQPTHSNSEWAWVEQIFLFNTTQSSLFMSGLNWVRPMGPIHIFKKKNVYLLKYMKIYDQL